MNEKLNKKLSQLLNPEKKIVGLDIGLSSVKIMQIEGASLDDAELTHYHIEPIPEHLNAGEYKSEEAAENIQALANIVKNCWEKSGVNTKNVCLAIPSSAIIYKKIIVPIFDNDDDLKLHLNQELSQFLPTTDSTEIVLDYYIIGVNEKSESDQDVMLVAARKEKVDDRLAIVSAAGLNPVILDVEQYAIQNILRLMKSEDFNKKTYMLVDASATTLRLIVFRNGNIIFTKDVSIGGLNLTKEIVNSFACSTQEAEACKTGRDNISGYEIIKENFLSVYMAEFLTALQYFISSNNNSHIDEIILTGGMSGLEGIENSFIDALKEHLEFSIKTEPYIAKPLENIKKSNRISLNKFNKDEAGLFLVTSLALRHFLRNF